MTTSIESWLNDRSTNKTRGRTLGSYMLVFYFAVALGQTLVNVAPPAGSELLMLASALIGLSLVPIALTRLGEPELAELRPLGLGLLFEASRVGVVGAGVAGILVGSFYALGVVFARQIGLNVTETALFMSTVVLGGLGAQVPVGMLADRFDRRIVMACILLAVGLSWGLLATSVANGVSLGPLFVMALAFGQDPQVRPARAESLHPRRSRRSCENSARARKRSGCHQHRAASDCGPRAPACAGSRSGIRPAVAENCRR